MLRTKKEVDRHVQDIFRKLQDENERTLRCLKIAELYYNVNDYESAKRYLSRYIEVRKESRAHRLMGQILEALGQKEAALIQYKYSFELNAKQEDLILKICELLADPDVGLDINRAKYWIERADSLFPRHKIVFQLKEKVLSIEKPTNNEEDLENLILAELAARPIDVQLRVKLLKHYVDKDKFDSAYKHASEIETANLHRNSIQWYHALCDLFLKFKNTKQMNWNFWILYISSLERYAALAIKEQGISIKKTSEAIQAVYNFDQHLFEAKAQSFTSYPSLTEKIFEHMWGQLHYHLACLLLLNTKYEQSSWAEAGRLCSPLLLSAVHIKPIDLTEPWAAHLDSPIKNQLQLWYREGSYRCSQAGHVLQDYAKGNQRKLINNIEKFCTGSWRERVYQRIFVSRIYQKIRTSYFTNNNAPSPPLRLVSQIELKRFDEVAEEVWPYSLHHQVWPAIKSRNSGNRLSKYEEPQPNLSSHLFPDLQYSVHNINNATPVSLCRLDIDAFINAAALCASAVDEEHQKNTLLSPERLPTLPADLTNPLCTEEQEKWWLAACKLYHKETADELGEIRQTVQRGLEVVRCIGNHGLQPVILVHLARVFQYRAKQLKEKNSESSDIAVLESRSELYWSAVVPLLERLQNNQTIRISNVKLFEYIGKSMNNMELTHAIEEGKILLAQKLLRELKYQQAIESLQLLKSPEASFEQGKIYKKLADDLILPVPRESVTSELRSQHAIILTKARNSFYLTLDRLRSPDADPKHPLNAELYSYITEIENELKSIDPDTNLYSDRNRNDYDDLSEESYSSAHSEEHAIVNNSLTLVDNSTSQTPTRNAIRTPRQSSTPRTRQLHDTIDITRNRIEARPSPERLDAQIRQLVHSFESLKEQSREQHRIMIAKLDELIRISANNKENTKEAYREPPKEMPKSRAPHVNYEDLYPLLEEEYRDYGNYGASLANVSSSGSSRTPAQAAIPQNLFAAQRHLYSPLVYPSPTAALPNFFQGAPAAAAAAAVAAGGLPFADPTIAAASQHQLGLYAAAAAAAAAGYPVSSLYRTGLEQQPLASMQQMSDSVLHQGLFSQKLPDYTSTPQQPQQQQPMGLPLSETVAKNDSKLNHLVSDMNMHETGSSLLKDTSIPPPPPPSSSSPPPVTSNTSSTIAAQRKVPPVNVVITTSDTLPTTAPAAQPTLSVTIPTQHRLGVSTASSTVGQDSVPHSYQISMPSQPTIPTTVNLPPLSTTLTVATPIAKTNVTDNQNSSIVSTGSRHNASDSVEIEHDPIPDFAPIIPLPDEVPVTTGEENEETLFCERAKLFRFVDKEWKERGVGNVKLLKSRENGRVRLLMRREQVHKICANHMLRSEMELSLMPNTDRAYVWVANDFADEEVKLEKLCIRFKTAEEATSFKEAFDKARNNLPAETATPDKAKSTSSATEKPKIETSKSIPAPVTSTFKTDATIPTSKPATQFGGFTFTSTPVIQKPVEQPQPTPAKPNPFAGFSFGKSTEATLTKVPVFSFGSAATKTPETIMFDQNDSKSTSEESQTSSPEVSKLTEKENEVVVLEQTASLMHFCHTSKYWNDKGGGVIKVLLEKPTGNIRFLMNTLHKTVFNETISPAVTLNLKAETINWIDKNKPGDSYLLRFSNYDQASSFHKAVVAQLQKSSKSTANSVPLQQKPLSEMFRPAAGSWECKDCYTRNNAGIVKCLACNAPAPGSSLSTRSVGTTETISTAKTPQSVSRNLFDKFKPTPGSWECKDCYTRNDAGVINCLACNARAPDNASNPNEKSNPALTSTVEKPLSELFKPTPGSWECNACYTRNTQSNQYCVACDAPKDPSLPPKPKTVGGFSINAQTPETKPTFSFGIPAQSTATAAATAVTGNKDASTTSFSFNFSKSVTDKPVSSPISIFTANKPSTQVSGFNFGAQPPKTPPAEPGNAFSFGSPGKGFDFQFQSKSPPSTVVKSPERPETSDDEQVEESEDVYFTPVIPLPDKIDVKTGEENEEVLYSHRAKLFKFDTTTKEWKERGLGDIKLLKHVETKKLRLVMRRDQVLKLCLNHAMSSDIEIRAKDDKTWMWSAGDYSEGEIEYIQFACRFKNPEIAGEFKQSVDNACMAASKNSPKKEDSTTKESTRDSDDIQIVYEVKVTPEEKAAALKLQLPENFYAYKLKDDCPGCIGCREPAESLYKTNETKTVTGTALTTKSADTTPVTTTSSNFAFNMFSKPATFAVNSQSVFKTSTFSPTTSTNIFGGNKTDDAKITGFLFGQTVSKPDVQESKVENLKICSPTSKTSTSSTATSAPAVTSIFSGFGTSVSTTTTTTTTTNIFSGFGGTSSFGKSTTSIFGSAMANATSTTPAFSFTPNSTTSPATTITATKSSNIFNINKSVFGSTPSSTSITFSSSIFGGTSTAASTTLASTTSSSLFFGSNATATKSVFGATANNTTATSIFGSTAPAIPTTASIFGANAAANTATTPTFGVLTSSAKAVFGSATDVTATMMTTSPTSVFGATVTTTSSVWGVSTTKAASLFGTAATVTSATPVFGANTTIVTSTTPLFGTSTSVFSSGMLFGGQTTIKPIVSSTIFQADATGSQSTDQNTKSTTNARSVTMPAAKGSFIFSSKPLFGGASAPPTSTGVPNTKSMDEVTTNNNEVGGGGGGDVGDSYSGGGGGAGGVSFLPTDNALSFSDLAAQTKPDQKPAFKTDPNFAFEGAGTSVFGAKPKKPELTKLSKNSKSEHLNEDNVEEGDGDDENGDEHDPYFEPIVPLPDAIEVKTGEEDEEKIFGQRAKLYRYDHNTKEWKERGTGEMKILHHSQNGTYRLLLRREQVFKIVCNLLLTADLEFRELNTSNRAWVWAAMNYADPDNPEVEQLAVRFKSQELAVDFKKAIDKAQCILAEKHKQASTTNHNNFEERPQILNQDNKVEDEQQEQQDVAEAEEEEEDKYEDDEYYEDEEGDEDEDGHVQLFENPATIFARSEDGSAMWEHLATGTLKVIYDSSIFGATIVFEDMNKKLLSETVISMDMDMQCIDKECIWAGKDYALNQSDRRILKAVFSSPQTSQEMYAIFQEGKEYAIKADIRE